MEQKINLHKEFKVCDYYFRKYFPKIKLKNTTFTIYYWRDNSCRIELKHSGDGKYVYKLLLTCDTKKHLKIRKESNFNISILIKNNFISKGNELITKDGISEKKRKALIKKINGETIFEGFLLNKKKRYTGMTKVV